MYDIKCILFCLSKCTSLFTSCCSGSFLHLLSVQTVLKSYKPVEVVRVLLGQRADPSTTDSEGKTPLHHAAASSSSLAHQITLLLMKDKENLVAQDENSAAPIHVASRHGQVEILVALLDNGVDINSRGHAGATPLHVSVSSSVFEFYHQFCTLGNGSGLKRLY